MNRFLAIAIILLSTATGIAGCSQSPTISSGDVQVFTAVRGDIRQEITPSGNLMMPNVARLNFGAAGTVTDVYVDIGDAVKAGQPLAKLDTLALEQALIQTKISYKTAQMALERAKVAASVDPLDIEIKTLAVEQARLKLIEAQDDLDSATIRAPFDGLIGQVPINVNDTVTGAQLAIRLVDPTQIQVNAFVNEMDIFLVKAGMAATVSVDALASGVKMPATVYAISPYTDPSSGVVNYLVKLKVKVPSNYFAGSGADTGTSLTTATSFKEGLTASVTIIIDEKKSVIIIPNKAVTRPAGSRDSVVQFVKPDGTVEQRVVQTGISSSQNIEIVSGLNEGDRVAVFRTSATPTPGQVRIPRL